MGLLASLRSRIFAATALVAVLPVVAVSLLATSRLTREAESELARALAEAARLVERFHASERAILEERALLVADLPRLKAAVAEGDAPTVEPVAADYRERVKADVLVVTGAGASPLASIGLVTAKARESARTGERFVTDGPRLVDLVTVPIVVGTGPGERLGHLTLGVSFDERTVARIHDLTGSDVALAFGERVLASTLPRDDDGAVLLAAAEKGPVRVRASGGEYAALATRLGGADGPVALVMRSRTEALRPVRTVRTALLLALGLAVAVSVLLSYAVARTVTRPLAALTDGMRVVAETGDLTRKIGPGGPWDDEDARLVARRFDALTDSIARFQRDAAFKDRLSALGRLSTVVAHEVRNPLMIIKGAARSLRRGEGASDEVREVAGEIDQEVSRIDRIVGDVLDFARPLKVEMGLVDLAAVCREAVREVPQVAVEVEVGLGPVETDADRLRAVLVNLVQNARDSLVSRAEKGESGRSSRPLDEAGARGAEILVSARRLPGGEVALVVADRGCGIAESDLSQVFEPYFTTKRKGTGLGLAIVRKTIESLGGRIWVDSRLGEGTRVEIRLPGTPGAEAMRGPDPAEGGA